MQIGGDYDTPPQQEFKHDRGDDFTPDPPPGQQNKPIQPILPRITVTQKNPSSKKTAHFVAWEVVKPPVNTSPKESFRFDPLPVNEKMHELLFEIRKDGRIFWMGVIVPEGTTDFTRAHAFFHPFSTNKNGVIADEKDYPAFAGGWSGHMQGLMEIFGPQLAAAKAMVPMLVPFNTMAAVSSPDGSVSSENMFSTLPQQTIEAVLRAARQEITGNKQHLTVTALATSSFSSGIFSMRLFIDSFKSTGLVKEVVDFDGTFIKKIGRHMTFSPGAVSRVYTQALLFPPPPGWVNLLPQHFDKIKFVAGPGKKPEEILHQRIGKMMFHQALFFSSIK